MNSTQGRGDRKSTVDYWDDSWRRASNTSASESWMRRGFFWRRFDQALQRCFSGIETRGKRLIEIGAGGSEWLPYLHQRFGFNVDGLDYSEVGCRRAREVMSACKTPGEIFQGDMFSPPHQLLGAYDVVTSFGLVEHFEDTASALRACSAFAKVHGLVVTSLPNMKGLYGLLYRVFDRKVFDMHVPLDLEDLRSAHSRAGLSNVSGEYILGLPGVVDGDRVEPVFLRRLARSIGHRLSRFYFAFEENGFGIPENRFSSPYLVCAATKESRGVTTETPTQKLDQ